MNVGPSRLFQTELKDVSTQILCVSGSSAYTQGNEHESEAYNHGALGKFPEVQGIIGTDYTHGYITKEIPQSPSDLYIRPSKFTLLHQC